MHQPSYRSRLPRARTFAGAGGALPPQPCILVTFGAAGDLSWPKLMPAVYNLNVDGLLPGP